MLSVSINAKEPALYLKIYIFFKVFEPLRVNKGLTVSMVVFIVFAMAWIVKRIRYDHLENCQ